MSDSFIGRQLYKVMTSQTKKRLKEGQDTPTGAVIQAFIREMPLRGMLMLGGPLNRPRLEALLLMINDHFFKGLLAFIKAGSSKS
jgi:hypothetical protein